MPSRSDALTMMTDHLPTDTALILAGGKGTRIQSVHPDIPKPLIAIGGKPFLRWQIDYLYTQGIRRVILSTGYMADKIEAYFVQRPIADVALTCVREETALGTGGAIRYAAQGLETEWVLVCNGDSLCPADLACLRRASADHRCHAVILCTETEDVSDCGTVRIDADGCVTGFLEKGATCGPGLVNAGVYLMQTAWARELPGTMPLSIERDVFPVMPHGQIRATVTATPFLDIGVPERLEKAEEFLRLMVTG